MVTSDLKPFLISILCTSKNLNVDLGKLHIVNLESMFECADITPFLSSSNDRA